MKRGQETILLVNGFGGTPMLELYLMVTAAHKVLAGAGIKVARAPDRLLRHLARDGRLLDLGDRRRRRVARAVGCAGAHGRPALGRLRASRSGAGCRAGERAGNEQAPAPDFG